MSCKCIFIDESGQREYSGIDSYFVNCGIIVNKDSIPEYEN